MESISSTQLFMIVVAPVAALCHWKILNYLMASLVATVAAIVLLQIIFYWQVGYLDPFFMISIVTTGAASFILSLVVGLPFYWARKNARVRKSQ